MKKVSLDDEHSTFMKDLEELSAEENSEEDIFLNQTQVKDREINNINSISEEKTPTKSSRLLTNPNFIKILEEIKGKAGDSEFNLLPSNLTKESRVYHLISECNKFISEINQEINLLFKELKELYSERFPELASIIFKPYEYTLTVKALGNDLDVSKVDLSYLPSNVQLSLNIMSSSTSGKMLSKTKLSRVFELCDDILLLINNRTTILSFIENKMSFLCPNLSALVGPSIAAKLVTAAGGVVELAKMPASNVLVMGAQKVNLEGFSTAGKLHMGYLCELEEVQKTPEKHKRQIMRKYACKSVLMVRIDAYRTTTAIKDDLILDKGDKMLIETGDMMDMDNDKILNDRSNREGSKIKEEIGKKMSKLIDCQQPVLKKPLPRPDDKPRRKRGGKRVRNIKERLALTEMRMMKNRMKFGPDAEIEYRESGKGLGLLGVGGTGSKMKTAAKEQKINTKKQKLLALESQQYSTKGSASGLHSSVSFTPVEGIELINPELLEKRYANVKEKYFSSTSGFSTVTNQKKNSSSKIYEI